MFVKLIKLGSMPGVSWGDNNKKISLQEVIINCNHIIKVEPDSSYCTEQARSLLPEDLDERQKFVTIYINEGQSSYGSTFVGSLSQIEDKLRQAMTSERSKVLRG